jgi:2,3,4,5-tetrahydropyridine-2-carboxylate N-succinyltransferase
MLEDMSASGDRGAFTSYDKNTDSLKDMDSESCVRDAPGGSSIRDGSYLGKGVVCMPPIFVSVGAYVDAQAPFCLGAGARKLATWR